MRLALTAIGDGDTCPFVVVVTLEYQTALAPFSSDDEQCRYHQPADPTAQFPLAI